MTTSLVLDTDIGTDVDDVLDSDPAEVAGRIVARILAACEKQSG